MKTARVGAATQNESSAPVKSIVKKSSRNIPERPLRASAANPAVIDQAESPAGFPNEAPLYSGKRRHFTVAEEQDANRWLFEAGSGDQAAFGRLVEKFQTFALNIAYRHCRHPDDAKDAAQNAWISLWKGAPRLAAAVTAGEPANAVGLICVAATMSARAIMVYSCALKRGGAEEQRWRLEHHVRRELLGFHAYKHHGRDCEWREETPVEDDTFRRMGMVHRLVAELPPDAAAKLDGYFFKEKSLAVLAEERATTINNVKRGMKTAIEVLRYLCFKEEDAQCA